MAYIMHAICILAKVPSLIATHKFYYIFAFNSISVNQIVICLSVNNIASRKWQWLTIVYNHFEMTVCTCHMSKALLVKYHTESGW